MFRSIVTCFFTVISLLSVAQITCYDAEIIVQSRHVWRGSQLGTAPAIEPSVTFSGGRFSFNVWASVTTNNSYSEIDLIPSWQFRDFSFTIYDYYNPVPGEVNQYFNLKNGKSRHSLELAIDNYSIEKYRFKWMVGTFISGDKNAETGNPFYSTYLELKYPFSFLKIDMEPFVGVTPFKGYYAGSLAVINSGIAFSKELKLSSRFSVPIVLTYIFNPYSDEQMVTVSSGLVFSSDN